jgi:hypothetical protein
MAQKQRGKGRKGVAKSKKARKRNLVMRMEPGSYKIDVNAVDLFKAKVAELRTKANELQNETQSDRQVLRRTLEFLKDIATILTVLEKILVKSTSPPATTS